MTKNCILPHIRNLEKPLFNHKNIHFLVRFYIDKQFIDIMLHLLKTINVCEKFTVY